MTQKAFKAPFETLMNFYDELKSHYKLTIRDNAQTLLFVNAFSNEH